MAFTSRGAISISVRKEHHYSLGQKIINGIVQLAPGLLGRIAQQPTITIHESFSREGIPLSAQEILKLKRCMIDDAIREMDSLVPSWQEATANAGSLKRVTVAYGLEGLQEISEEPYNFLDDKIQSILSITPATKDCLKQADIDLNVLVGVIKGAEKPAIVANRIEKLVKLIDDFDMPRDLEFLVTQKIKSVIQDLTRNRLTTDNSYGHTSVQRSTTAPDVSFTCDLSTLPGWPRSLGMQIKTETKPLTIDEKIHLIGSNIERQKTEFERKGITLSPMTQGLFAQWEDSYNNLRSAFSLEACDRFLERSQALLDAGNLPNHLGITCDANMSLTRGIKVEIDRGREASKRKEGTNFPSKSDGNSLTLTNSDFPSATHGILDEPTTTTSSVTRPL